MQRTGAHSPYQWRTRILVDIIEDVSRSAPALAPLFRSDQQLRLLTVLFADSEEELSIHDLVVRAGVAQATASREVARLADHGIVVTRSLGRNTLVRANWSLPWAKDLRSILVQTVGVLGQLSEALGTVGGVEEALIFGSWAARYEGEPGPPPRDIDLLVVGDADLRTVRRACRPVQEALRVEINPIVLTTAEWTATAPDPFVAQLRSQQLVPVPLNHT
jgi:DNA-binding transcriptional ArsR family regulator